MKENLNVQNLNPNAIPEAAAVIASAMINNPLHIAIFGNNSYRNYRKHIKLFEKVLSQQNTNVYVIKEGERIVGVMNYYCPGQCQLNTFTTLRMLPGLFWHMGLVLLKILKWKSLWGKYDITTSHFHFGPLAVLPELQGNGIGSALIKTFCGLVDHEKTDAYLETDKPENVALYKKYGFKTLQSQKVFGVNNWFMCRKYTMHSDD